MCVVVFVVCVVVGRLYVASRVLPCCFPPRWEEMVHHILPFLCCFPSLLASSSLARSWNAVLYCTYCTLLYCCIVLYLYLLYCIYSHSTVSTLQYLLYCIYSILYLLYCTLSTLTVSTLLLWPSSTTCLLGSTSSLLLQPLYPLSNYPLSITVSHSSFIHSLLYPVALTIPCLISTTYQSTTTPNALKLTPMQPHPANHRPPILPSQKIPGESSESRTNNTQIP